MKSIKTKLRIVKINSHVKIGTKNAIKGSHDPAEKSAHRKIKYILGEYCYQNGWEFWSEVLFMDNSRSDFLISDLGLCLEILSSETLKQFKKKKYPCPVIPVRVKDHEFEIIEMLNELKNFEGKNWSYYKNGIK